MEETITATDLAKRLSDILNRVRYRNERFVIERNEELVATLGPAGARSGAILREMVTQLDTLSLPCDGFADELEEIQSS